VPDDRAPDVTAKLVSPLGEAIALDGEGGTDASCPPQPESPSAIAHDAHATSLVITLSFPPPPNANLLPRLGGGSGRGSSFARVSTIASELTIGYQGEPGAYSEEALHTTFPTAKPQAFRTLRHAFHRVADQSVDFALVPVENSQGGSVLETYDLLLEYRALVVAEVALQVDHCLLALPGTDRDQIKRVLSHPQALAQCEAFIVREHLEPIPAYDTAGAAKQIQQEGRKDQAAIAGRRAAELYRLEIMAERIQTVQENITRFFLITRRGPRRPKAPRIKRPRYGKKTSVVCAVANEPGALFRLLACFADEGVNLTKLESRPRRDPPWEYLFYLDLDGGRSEKPVAASLRAARHATTFLQVLGTYARALPLAAPPKRRSRKRRSPAEP
jgi:prephenate dehydratase